MLWAIKLEGSHKTLHFRTSVWRRLSPCQISDTNSQSRRTVLLFIAFKLWLTVDLERPDVLINQGLKPSLDREQQLDN